MPCKNSWSHLVLSQGQYVPIIKIELFGVSKRSTYINCLRCTSNGSLQIYDNEAVNINVPQQTISSYNIHVLSSNKVKI